MKPKTRTLTEIDGITSAVVEIDGKEYEIRIESKGMTPAERDRAVIKQAVKMSEQVEE